MVLVKSSPVLFSLYFLKYINPKLFKPLQTEAFSLTHKQRAKSCLKKQQQQKILILNRVRKKNLLVYLLKKMEKYRFNMKLKYVYMHTHTGVSVNMDGRRGLAKADTVMIFRYRYDI